MIRFTVRTIDFLRNQARRVALRGRVIQAFYPDTESGFMSGHADYLAEYDPCEC